MRKRGLRLPLPRRADPVLDEEELRTIEDLLRLHIDQAKAKQRRGRVSESVLRSQYFAEAALEKVSVALDARDRPDVR